jgi:hypothetical protein
LLVQKIHRFYEKIAIEVHTEKPHSQHSNESTRPSLGAEHKEENR